MPVIRINADGARPGLHRNPMPWQTALERTDTGTGPVIAMVHGFRYQPGDPRHCPHRHILSLHPDDTPYSSPSWPRHLQFGAGHSHEGLAIAFGWRARGALWQAHKRAGEAGRALAEVLAHIHARHPNRPIHMLAHSMGIELCLEALHHLPAGAVGRIISMAGASYRTRVNTALATPAGKRAEFINVVSRENDIFEAMFEWIIAPPCRGDRAIGLGVTPPNAVTLQIDCADTLDHLDRIGQPVGDPDRRICHWSAYARPGILPLYNALLRRPGSYPLDLLRQGLPPAPARRWSRLLILPSLPRPLPAPEKAS